MKMTMKIITATYILILLAVYNLMGQVYTEIKDVDILAGKKIVVEKEYPYSLDTMVILDVFKISDKHSKIVYQDEGIYHEAIVNDDRKDMLLVATAIELPKEQLPEIIESQLKEGKYSAWNIDKRLVMRTPYEGWFYAIDISQGNKQQRIYFDKLGAYKTPPY